MSDLVSRLLGAIEAKEQKARAVQGLGVLLNWPRKNGKATLQAFLEDNDPVVVIERCEADRSIVMTYSAVAQYDDWENSYEHATGRACGLGEAVRIIGGCYGLTEEGP